MMPLEQARLAAAEIACALHPDHSTARNLQYIEQRQWRCPLPRADWAEAQLMCVAWKMRYDPSRCDVHATNLEWMGRTIWSWTAHPSNYRQHLYEIRPDGSDPLANMRMCCAVLAMEPGGILSDILEQLRSAEYRMVVRDISQDLYEITTGRHQDTQRRKRERETERTPFAQARTPRFLLSKVKEKGVVDLIGRFFSDSITPGDPVPIR